jgi:hypothetical protein
VQVGVAVAMLSSVAVRGALAQRERIAAIAARWSEAAAGSEVERYLRVAQLGGEVALTPWTVRAFGPQELTQLLPASGHVWRDRFVALPTTGVWLHRPQATLDVNSGLAYGMNDGPAWSGRGLNASATLGATWRWRGVTAQIAPVLWWAQNADFALLPVSNANRYSARGDFARGGIDLPQRLADGTVGRVDPGESYVRVDVLGVTAGVSTAAEWWGPGVSSGVLLSNNAGGVPRVFAGTSRPLNIGIGTVHGRVFMGRLRPSGAFRDANNDEHAQLLTAGVGSFSPRGLPNLELGATRFIHEWWPSGGPGFDNLKLLWSNPTPNAAVVGSSEGNQLASLFARVTIPQSGTEVYTEYATDDRNGYDNFDLITQPDHDALTMFGFQQRIGAAGAPVWWAVRGETTNARMTHLDNVRSQVLFFQHSAQAAGHTLRGQVLGSPYVRGGSGAELGVDRYDARGRMGARWTRQGLAVNEVGGLGYGALHTVEASVLRFTARGDLTLRAALTQRVGSAAAYDATNVHVSVGWRLTK